MLKRVFVAVAAVFCTLLFAFVGLCLWASFYATGSTSCQLASGRQIMATTKGIYVGMTTQQDTATIDTFRRTVTIAPTSLQVDGRNVASIPATTKVVEVNIDGSEVTFVADGKAVGGVWR